MNKQNRMWAFVIGAALLLWLFWSKRKSAAAAPVYEAGYPTSSRATPHFTWQELIGDQTLADENTRAALGIARILEVVRHERGDLPMLAHVPGMAQQDGKAYVLFTADATPGESEAALWADVAGKLAQLSAIPSNVSAAAPVFAIDRDIALQWGATAAPETGANG